MPVNWLWSIKVKHTSTHHESVECHRARLWKVSSLVYFQLWKALTMILKREQLTMEGILPARAWSRFSPFIAYLNSHTILEAWTLPINKWWSVFLTALKEHLGNSKANKWPSRGLTSHWLRSESVSWTTQFPVICHTTRGDKKPRATLPEPMITRGQSCWLPPRHTTDLKAKVLEANSNSSIWLVTWPTKCHGRPTPFSKCPQSDSPTLTFSLL